MSFAVAGWAGEQQAPLDAVNATIRRDGFSPLPSVRRMAGLDVQAVYSRTRAGVSLGAGRATTKDPREGRELVSWLSTVGIQAGVDVLRYRTLSVFVSAGIVAGRLSLESSDARLLLLDGRTHDKAAFGFSALPLEIGTECIAGDKGDPASRTGLFEPVQFDRERAGVTGRDRHCHQGRNDGSHRCRQPGPECDPARHHRNHQPRALASENLNVLPRAASLWRNSLYWVSKTFSTPKRASQPLNSP